MASKTARRSSPQLARNATPEELIAAAATSATRRLTPLAEGRYCRISDPVGRRSPQLATDSAAFDELLGTLGAVEVMRTRLISEMSAFADEWPASAWPAVLARVTGPGGPLSGERADGETPES